MRCLRKNILIKEEKLFYIKKMVIDMNNNIDAIIVEGRHDEDVFLSLGFQKKIIKCSSKDLETIKDELKNLKRRNEKIKVAIFTDFDEKGKELNKKIKEYLQKNGIIIENFYRSKMKEIAIDIREIEDLNRMISKDNFIVIL
ncbi:MAG: hypothetical protein QXJ96_01435 [Candidatus Aenigmatarchaeota archaeon]|nr:hypothetical protein [Candidatus Aenigmarchaeota archaeon]